MAFPNGPLLTQQDFFFNKKGDFSSSHQAIKQRPSQDKRTQPANQFSRPKFLHRTTEISPRLPFRQEGVDEDRNEKASDEVEEEALI